MESKIHQCFMWSISKQTSKQAKKKEGRKRTARCHVRNDGAMDKRVSIRIKVDILRFDNKKKKKHLCVKLKLKQSVSSSKNKNHKTLTFTSKKQREQKL